MTYKHSGNNAIKGAYIKGYDNGKMGYVIDECPYQKKSNKAFANAWYAGYEDGLRRTYNNQIEALNKKLKDKTEGSIPVQQLGDSVREVVIALLKLKPWARKRTCESALHFCERFN